jgi:hypothetical protein
MSKGFLLTIIGILIIWVSGFFYFEIGEEKKVKSFADPKTVTLNEVRMKKITDELSWVCMKLS